MAHAFRAAFGAENRAEDLALHLAQSYSPSLQRAELLHPDIRTLVAEAADELAGCAQVRRGAAVPPCVPGPGPVELWRFYLDPSWIGRGIAMPLMEAALDAARDLGGRRCWLSVWERNPRAIAFYRKAGFSEAGTTVFHVGNDPQTDRVMVRAL